MEEVVDADGSTSPAAEDNGSAEHWSTWFMVAAGLCTTLILIAVGLQRTHRRTGADLIYTTEEGTSRVVSQGSSISLLEMADAGIALYKPSFEIVESTTPRRLGSPSRLEIDTDVEADGYQSTWA